MVTSEFTTPLACCVHFDTRAMISDTQKRVVCPAYSSCALCACRSRVIAWSSILCPSHPQLLRCIWLYFFSFDTRDCSLNTTNTTTTLASPNHNRCFCGNDLPAPGRGGWQPPSANHTGPWWCVRPLSSAPCNADCYRSNRTAPVTELCCCPGNATQGCGSVGLLQVLPQLSTHTSA